MVVARKQKEIVGWTEYVDFPLWEISGLKAKIDTGARTSALHVEDLRPLSGGNVEFHVILSRRKKEKKVLVRAKTVKWSRVRSSTGDYHTRCFVKTRIRIGHIEKEIEITLVSREKMIFRMLIGRKALEDDFLVDVDKRSVLSDSPKSRRRKSE